MLVSATADVHPEAVVEATDAFQVVLRELAEHGPSADHLEAHHRNVQAAITGEDAPVARLDATAMAMLFGVPDPQVQEGACVRKRPGSAQRARS